MLEGDARHDCRGVLSQCGVNELTFQVGHDECFQRQTDHLHLFLSSALQVKAAYRLATDIGQHSAARKKESVPH
jgi:hypothetical protein